MASEGGKKLNRMDAMRFLMTVKNTFQDQGKIYDEFCEVMRNFQAHRIGTAVVAMKVQDMFKGHNDLILEFNKFLPKESEILLPPKDEQPSQNAGGNTMEEALDYVTKIKVQFQHDDSVYKSFKIILEKYNKREIPLLEVVHQVNKLFKDHLDLFVEFTKFLP